MVMSSFYFYFNEQLLFRDALDATASSWTGSSSKFWNVRGTRNVWNVPTAVRTWSTSASSAPVTLTAKRTFSGEHSTPIVCCHVVCVFVDQWFVVCLKEIRYKVRRMRPGDRSVAGGATGPAERLPPRMFPVSALRTSTGHWRRVLSDGGPQTRLQTWLRVGQNQRFVCKVKKKNFVEWKISWKFVEINRSRRWQSAQKATDDHHGQAARDAQVGLQRQPQTGEARPRAAQSGHRTGHAGSPGLVPEQVTRRFHLIHSRVDGRNRDTALVCTSSIWNVLKIRWNLGRSFEKEINHRSIDKQRQLTKWEPNPHWICFGASGSIPSVFSFFLIWCSSRGERTEEAF